MTDTQLRHWQGEFGEAYTRRNQPNWRDRKTGLKRMLEGIEPGSVLEVGCNRGHNLVALRRLGWDVAGVEPGRYARRLAHKDHLDVRAGSIYEIPYADASFDLVLCAGVLIHVPPERLDEAIRELARVSKRWLLTVEYHAETDTPILYRGETDLLWKRDYPAHLAASLPDWTVDGSGEADWDDDSFTLLRHQSSID